MIRILSKSCLLQQLLAVLADPFILVVADVVPHLVKNKQNVIFGLIRDMTKELINLNQASFSEYRLYADVVPHH